MEMQERLDQRPRLLRGGTIIARPCVAEEAVVRIGEDDLDVRLASFGESVRRGAALLRADVAVPAAPEEEHRAVEARSPIEHSGRDAATVVGDRGAQWEQRVGEERD